MNSEIMPGWMDYTVIRTYHLSVCIKISTFEKSRLFILFYSILLYSICLSLTHTLSLVRSLLSIDPSMTSGERRGEREGNLVFLVIFGVFFVVVVIGLYR